MFEEADDLPEDYDRLLEEALRPPEPRITQEMRLALPESYRDLAETPEAILEKPDLHTAETIRVLHESYGFWSRAHESFPEKLAAVAREILSTLEDPSPDLEIRVSVMEIEGRRRKPQISKEDTYQAFLRRRDGEEDSEEQAQKLLDVSRGLMKEHNSRSREREARAGLLQLLDQVGDDLRLKADLLLRVGGLTTVIMSPLIFSEKEDGEEEEGISFPEVGRILTQAWEIAKELGDVHLEGLALTELSEANFRMAQRKESDPKRLVYAIEMAQEAVEKIDQTRDPEAYRAARCALRSAANWKFKKENPGSILEVGFDGRLGPGLFIPI